MLKECLQLASWENGSEDGEGFLNLTLFFESRGIGLVGGKKYIKHSIQKSLKLSKPSSLTSGNMLEVASSHLICHT